MAIALHTALLIALIALQVADAALFAAIDVSEQGPFEAMARLGLSIAQVSE